MGRPAKALSVYADRGFKSHPLRQMHGLRRFCRSLAAAIIVFSSVITGVFVSSSSVSAASCPQGQASYKVVRNDSWSRISVKVKVSMKSLLAANKATTRSMLLIGDVICLPSNAAVAGSPQKARRAQTLTLAPPDKVFSRKASTRIIREVFPRRLQTRALAIAQRESRMNAAAYNWCCVGLFQLNWWSHRTWLANMGVTSPQQLLDARVNAEAAFALYKRSGSWAPWG